MRILFLSAWFPYPPRNGTTLRSFNLIRQLAHRYDIDLLSFADDAHGAPDAAALRAVCRPLALVPRRWFEPRSARAHLGWLRRAPRSVVATYSAEMAQRIAAALRAERYDVVIASDLTMAAYWDAFRGVPALFEEVQLGGLYEQGQRAATAWQRARFGLTWWKHCRYLTRLLRGFRACTVPSERERALLAEAVPDFDAVTIVPNCVDLADYAEPYGDPQPDTLIFTGSFRYAVNHDAMVWFLREIYPRVQAARPNVRLRITGDHASAPLPASARVELTGYVADVRPLVAAAAVSVVPLRAGAGTRLKILESMALGTPVVSTTKGAEGLDVVDGEHLLLADDPQAFARRTVQALTDAALRRRLTDNARRLIAARYDWRIVGPCFADLVAGVAAAGR